MCASVRHLQRGRGPPRRRASRGGPPPAHRQVEGAAQSGPGDHHRVGNQPSGTRYEFTALKPMPYQFDGEVHSVPANIRIRVDSAPSALTVIG
jgi:hypothetical protein